MKKICLVFSIIVLCVFMSSGVALSLSIDHGTRLLMVDGNDTDSTLDINVYNSSTLELGYYLNYGPVYHTFVNNSSLTFNGGDIVDFGMHNLITGEYYTLSGYNSAPGTYAVSMDFSAPISITNAGNPNAAELLNRGINEYYKNVTINWDLDMNPATSPDYQISFAMGSNFDGLAVPEPGTLILMGSGLIGGALYFRRKK